MEESFTEAGAGAPAMYVYADDEVIEPGQAPRIDLRTLNEHPGFLRSEYFESVLDKVTVPLLPAEVDILRRPAAPRRLRQPPQEPLNTQPSQCPSNLFEVVGLTPLVPYSQTQSAPSQKESAPTSQETLLGNSQPPPTTTTRSSAFLETLKLSPFMRECMDNVLALRDSDPPDWMEGWQVNIL